MSDAAVRMDRIYGWQSGLYDVTRRFYLLGRDQLIADLAPPDGGRVLEIGCGTARNLVLARRRWPRARFFGVDISSIMLGEARRAAARAGLTDIVLAQGDASCFDARALLGGAQFERIYFSYSLSMIPDWEGALAQALDLLAPGGELHIVDFGDQADLPPVCKVVLRRWLRLFHVEPRDDLRRAMQRLGGAAFETRFAPLFGGYACAGALRRRPASALQIDR